MSDREEKKPRLEKMVDASEYKQKNTAINKLIKAFIPDNIYDLKDYIVSEIVIPTIKDGLDDTWNAVYFDERYADKVITRFLNREYEPNGAGGLFRIKDCPYDLRSVEIWYQMCWYFDSIL